MRSVSERLIALKRSQLTVHRRTFRTRHSVSVSCTVYVRHTSVSHMCVSCDFLIRFLEFREFWAVGVIDRVEMDRAGKDGLLSVSGFKKGPFGRLASGSDTKTFAAHSPFRVSRRVISFPFYAGLRAILLP